MLRPLLIAAALVLGFSPGHATGPDQIPGELELFWPGSRVSVELGDNLSTRIGAAFLEFIAVIEPDTANGFNGEQIVASVTVADPAGNLVPLRRGPPTPSERGAASLWWGVVPATQRLVSCATAALPQVWAANGELITEYGLACICIGAPARLDAAPSIAAALTDNGASRTIQVRWAAVDRASGYGVVAWDRLPEPDDFLAGAFFSASRINADTRRLDIVTETHAPTYFVAVFARNDTVPGGPEGCGSFVPYYRMEAVAVDNPTAVTKGRWGTVKKAIGVP